MQPLFSLVLVLGVTIPILLGIDSFMSRRAGVVPVWRELLTGAFWSELAASMTGAVNGWAAEHDANVAAKASRARGE